MIRSAAFGVALVAVSALPAAASDLKAVRAELARIPTVTGLSTLERMKACGIKIEPVPFTSLEKDGLFVLVSLPGPPGSASPVDGITLRWVQRKGAWEADSPWAKRLTADPARLDWMPC